MQAERTHAPHPSAPARLLIAQVLEPGSGPLAQTSREGLSWSSLYLLMLADLDALSASAAAAAAAAPELHATLVAAATQALDGAARALAAAAARSPEARECLMAACTIAGAKGHLLACGALRPQRAARGELAAAAAAADEAGAPVVLAAAAAPVEAGRPSARGSTTPPATCSARSRPRRAAAARAQGSNCVLAWPWRCATYCSDMARRRRPPRWRRHGFCRRSRSCCCWTPLAWRSGATTGR